MFERNHNKFAFEPYSPTLKYVSVEDGTYYDSGKYETLGPCCGLFPDGLSKANVSWTQHEHKIELQLTAGFLNAIQDTETKEVSAEVMWFITEPIGPN